MTAVDWDDNRPTDPRFTMGLVVDVVELLEAHGYPKAAPGDVVKVGSALFRLLYSDTQLGVPL